jgi:uncharacterized membrane-anchored protein
MGLRVRVFLALVCLLSGIGFAAAQQKAPESDVWTQITKLDWKFGPTQGSIGAIASIDVPQGFVFLGQADTRRFLELQGNLGADNNYTFGPRNLSWFSVFAFDASGYVKDDEKIDPDELLAILKQSNVASNEERKRRGLRTLVLESWHVPPHYDVQSKRLEWGTILRDESGEISVNYTVRLLGRSGVMSAVLVSDPASLDSDMKAFKTALAGFDFASGQKYSEFRAGDKVAEYGLTALVVGGAAAAAAKAGLFKYLGKFIWVGLLGLAGLWAAMRRFFSGRQA